MSNMYLKAIPKAHTRALPPEPALHLIHLSQQFDEAFVLMFLRKQCPETEFITHSERTPEAPIIFVSDDLDTVTQFVQDNPDTPTGTVLLTHDWCTPTTSAQTLLAQTDWYVIREMERQLFPDGHPFRVFRDGLRGGEEDPPD